MEFVQGDVTEADERFIMHGCNTRAKMGAGVAKAIKEKYPKAYEKYVNACQEFPAEKILGKVYPVDVEEKFIINAFTQRNYGSWHKEFDYELLEGCVSSLCSWLQVELSIQTSRKVAVPRIGCGRGKAEWEKVKPILEAAPVADFVVYDYEE